MSGPLILELCGTGNWTRPYVDKGYEVRCVDRSLTLSVKDGDVRHLSHLDVEVHGIVASPPCTAFAGSGSRWWNDPSKKASDVLGGLSIVDACLRIILMHKPQWWALENPVGRLRSYLGPPAWSFDPCDYGDPWTKRTLIWGTARKPPTSPVEPTDADYIHRQAPGWKRSIVRSETPKGFARAFFEANP